MPYANHADMDARYPGELAQAGPMVNGVLDEPAILLALHAADAEIDRALASAGWSVPILGVPADWVKILAVDLALYLATPTVLASQGDFSDRHVRYLAAKATLAQIAAGTLLIVTVGGLLLLATGGVVGAQPRQFGPGSL